MEYEGLQVRARRGRLSCVSTSILLNYIKNYTGIPVFRGGSSASMGDFNPHLSYLEVESCVVNMHRYARCYMV